MRELSVNEVEDVTGGFLIVIPPAVKVIGWAVGAAAAGAGAYYGSQHGSAAYDRFFF